MELETNIPIVDLFPYKIQDRSKFLFRDHPKGIDPDSEEYANYWGEQIKGYVEGVWVYDVDTWVWLPPKLNFYVNYAQIEDKNRDIRHPDFRDVEWIVFSYITGMDGFSGFEGDEEYTCNFQIEKIEKGEFLDEVELADIPESAKLVDGSGYKKFVHPWEYLTRHYLIEHKPEEPLGKALWENPRRNGLMLTCRGLGKSVSVFVGDLGHEMALGGIRSMTELDKVNKRMNFFAGCADAGQLNRSINAFRQYYYNQPGQFLRRAKREKDKDIKYWGALYKNLQGEWQAKGGSKLQHLVKDTAGDPEIQGSIIEFRPIAENTMSVSAGDRFRRIYAEEAGLLDIIEFYKYNKDSTELFNERVGSFFGLGTSGNMEKVQAAAKMLFNPEAYDMMSIPDYWRNPEKRIGLFVPTPYKYERYKDENGNTKIELAYERFFRNRQTLLETKSGHEYDAEVMHNPGTPDELLRPSDDSLMPKELARQQQSWMQAYDIFEKFSVGDFKWCPQCTYGVEFERDLTHTREPITEYGVDRAKIDNKGAAIIFEFPDLEHIPKNLYWAVYDPAAKDGQSGSFHSLLIYKFFYSGPEDTMYDCIVGEWIGRYDTLEENYEQVIKMSKFFNAKIFPEVNTPGFVDWCKRNDYWDMLEPDAYYLEQEIHGNKAIKRTYYQVGYQMNERKKFWCDQKIAGWLRHVKRKDPVTGAPVLQTMNWTFSPRLLDEIIHYNPKDNFDHISSLRGLMLLIGKLERDPIDLEPEEDEAPKSFIFEPPVNRYEQRPDFLKY